MGSSVPWTQILPTVDRNRSTSLDYVYPGIGNTVNAHPWAALPMSEDGWDRLEFNMTVISSTDGIHPTIRRTTSRTLRQSHTGGVKF